MVMLAAFHRPAAQQAEADQDDDHPGQGDDDAAREGIVGGERPTAPAGHRQEADDEQDPQEGGYASLLGATPHEGRRQGLRPDRDHGAPFLDEDK